LYNFELGKEAVNDTMIITTKASKRIVAFIVIVIAIVAVMNIYGEKDPVVNVTNTGIEIKAMYGLNVDFSEITEICLLSESMNDIGVGTRTNGFSGFGDALKGDFRSGSVGEILLFVRVDASPTIHIKRENARDIFISFRVSDTTIALYDEIEAAFLDGFGIAAELAGDNQTGSSKYRTRCAIKRDYVNQREG